MTKDELEKINAELQQKILDLEQQLESQTNDTNDTYDKIRSMKESKIPDFIKQNREAEKKLAELKNIVKEASKAVERLNKEQMDSLLGNPPNEQLGKIYKQGVIASKIIKHRDEFHCFCEIRERTRRERDGEPPTIWEFVEYLFSDRT